MAELQRKGVLVDFAKHDGIWRLVLLLDIEFLLSEDEVFDGGLLDAAAEVEGIGLQPLVPAGLLVAQPEHIPL